MKKVLLILLVLPLLAQSQSYKEPDPKWVSKYENNNYSVYDYLRIAEKVGWIPRKEGACKGSYQTFEKVFMHVAESSRNLEQMKISGLYYCGTDHEYLMQRYNRIYKPVNQETWDEYCPILYTLMHIDEN